MTKEFSLVILLALFGIGCATTNKTFNPAKITAERNGLNLTDGVSKPEAKIIAQAYLIENSPKENIDISKPRVYFLKYRSEGKDTQRYDVDFRYTDHTITNPYYWKVIIDPKSGEVKESRMASHK